jgi:hypothetical protein
MSPFCVLRLFLLALFFCFRGFFEKFRPEAPGATIRVGLDLRHPGFFRSVGLDRSGALRSPQGGAFRAKRRAKPTVLGPPPAALFCCTARRAASRQGWSGGTHFRFAMATATRATASALGGGFSGAAICFQPRARPRYSMCQTNLEMSPSHWFRTVRSNSSRRLCSFCQGI